MVLLGNVVEARDDGVTVFVPFPHDKKKPEGYQSVVGVELVDKRHISADQRKKAYVLNIPANSTGRILVDKGTYKISSLICNAPFHTEKHIQSGIQMTLNSK